MSDLIQAYRQLYELTEPECRTTCKLPQSCCSPEYCDVAIAWAQEEWGVTLSKTGHASLPLMGPEGCTAAPHFRPMCTAHTCAINSAGFTMDPKWDDKYFKLTDLVNRLEYERMEKNNE